MSNTKEIRDKIKTISNTKKITKAMEMVAASKMRKSQMMMRRSRPYASKIMQVISHLAMGSTEYKHSYLTKRDIKRVAYLIIGTDKGLCGGLNSNLFKTTLEHIQKSQQQKKEVELYLIGKKAESYFARFGLLIQGVQTGLSGKVELANFISIISLMLSRFDAGEIDAIKIVYNKFINTMSQVPTVEQLIPLVADESYLEQGKWDYIYEPDARDLLNEVLTRYVESTVYQAVIENIACEESARMVAMKSATDNAEELIKTFQLVYNKARQAGITQEISEIVGGAAAV